MDFKNKKVLVFGAAKSGIASAKLLKKLGALVTLGDKKSFEELEGSIKEAVEDGITLYLGKNPDDIIKYQDLIIVSPGIPCDLPFFTIAKQLNIKIWSEIELAYAITPCEIVAITGTNGKTTTTALTGEIIKDYIKDTHIVGNIGVPFTGEVLSLTPYSFVVAEISSFQLETIENFHPKISVVLNITPDHLDRHKTLENYTRIKERVFEKQSQNDFCILNYDDPLCLAMAEKTNARVLFTSTEVELIEGIFLKDNFIYVRWGNFNCKIIHIDELQILGMHNVANAMAAVAVSLIVGVSVETIAYRLKNFQSVEHRIEYVCTINNIDFYNDSKGTNPDSSIRAINAMKKPIILIAGGYDKNSNFDNFIQAFSEKVKFVVLIGKTTEKIIQSAQKYRFMNYCKAYSLEEAVDIAYEKATDGDCILLSPACASWDMFSDYEQRGMIFKEKVYNLQRSKW